MQNPPRVEGGNRKEIAESCFQITHDDDDGIVFVLQNSGSKEYSIKYDFSGSKNLILDASPSSKKVADLQVECTVSPSSAVNVCHLRVANPGEGYELKSKMATMKNDSTGFKSTDTNGDETRKAVTDNLFVLSRRTSEGYSFFLQSLDEKADYTITIDFSTSQNFALAPAANFKTADGPLKITGVVPFKTDRLELCALSIVDKAAVGAKMMYTIKVSKSTSRWEKIQLEVAEKAKRDAEEAENKRKADAEEAARKRKAAEEEAERKRKADADEAERKRKAAADEAERKRLEEEERKRKADEDARKKKEAEDAERKRKEDEERKKKEAEDAARRAKEEADRKAKEDADRKKREEDDARKKKEANEAERKREEDDARKKKEADEAERKRKEEEEKKKKEAEEAERKRKEEEEKKKKEAEEAESKRKAEEALRAEVERRLAEREAKRKLQGRTQPDCIKNRKLASDLGMNGHDALTAIRRDFGEINWALFEYSTDPIKLIEGGSQGLYEMFDSLSDDLAAVAIVRMAFGAGAFRRMKYIAIQWVGDNVKPMARAQVQQKHDKMVDLIGPAHMSLTLMGAGERNAQTVIKKVERVFVVDGSSQASGAVTENDYIQAIKEEQVKTAEFYKESRAFDMVNKK